MTKLEHVRYGTFSGNYPDHKTHCDWFGWLGWSRQLTDVDSRATVFNCEDAYLDSRLACAAMSTTVWSLLAVRLVAFVSLTTPATSTPCTSEHCNILDNQLNQLKAHLQNSLEHQWKFIQEQQNQLATLAQAVVQQQKQLEKQEHTLAEQEDGM